MIKEWIIDTPSKQLLILNAECLDKMDRSYISSQLEKDNVTIKPYFKQTIDNESNDYIVLPVKNTKTKIQVVLSDNEFQNITNIIIDDLDLSEELVQKNSFSFEELIIYDLDVLFKEWVYQQGDFEYEYKTGIFVELIDKENYDKTISIFDELDISYTEITDNENIQFIIDYNEKEQPTLENDLSQIYFVNNIPILCNLIYHESISLFDSFCNEYVYLKKDKKHKGLSLCNLNQEEYTIDIENSKISIKIKN